MSREWKTMIVSSRSHTNTLWRAKKSEMVMSILLAHMDIHAQLDSDMGGPARYQGIPHNHRDLSGIFSQYFKRQVGVFWSLTSRSLSGGGEGLFLRPLPRDLDPPLRQARSSSSLMGVEGLCTVSKSPESVHKHRQG